MFLSKNEIWFIHHQTKCELNCDEKHRDDKVEDHHHHLQMLNHDVYPNLDFKKINMNKWKIPCIPACRFRSNF